MMGDFIGSIECFNTYLKKNSKDVEAHCGKALAIFESGEPDLAIEALTEGLKLDPTHEYRRIRGWSKSTIERFEMGHCSRGIRLAAGLLILIRGGRLLE